MKRYREQGLSMKQQQNRSSSIRLFYSYAHADEELRDQLAKHLSQLKREELIEEWHDRQIVAGVDWSQAIDQAINTSHIILLLISSDFLASDYCYQVEVQRVLERYRRGEVYVIPIILRPCDWQTSPFAHLQCLPRDGKAITTWNNRDEAFLDVAQGLRQTINHLLSLSTSHITAQALPQPAIPNLYHEDWGEAPHVKHFYGREQELTTTQHWIVIERCRLVTLLGIGGIGKTTLAAQVAQQVKTTFSYVFWRSLYNAPPLEDILRSCVSFLADQQHINFPKTVNEQTLLLIDYLRKQRCLLILDNVKSILQSGHSASQYREGYENYGRLFQHIGETHHQSCLIITSREQPREIARLESKTAPARVLHLFGLKPDAGQHILSDKGLIGSGEDWVKLIDFYAGNPLALTLVSGTIRDVFHGKVSSFLKEEAALVGGTYDLLEEQFRRLSSLEQEVIYWLAIEREASSLDDLREDIVEANSRQKVIEALASLLHRSMIISSNTGRFTLQPVIMEYATKRFIKQICEEISTETIGLLNNHALIKARSKDYVQAAQRRLILVPVAEWLLENMAQQALEQKLAALMSLIHSLPARRSAYAAANILHLLLHLQYNLSNYDFSHVTIRQAYLQGVELRDVDFSHAHFVHTLFTDTFGNVRSVSINQAGNLLAAASVNGEVRLWSFPDGAPLLNYQGHVDEVWSVAFNADSTLIASSSSDRTIHVWEASTGRRLHVLRGHTEPVVRVAFAPSGSLLASAGYDNMVHLWDAQSGQLQRTLERHGNWVRSVVFSPDEKLLATGCLDQTVKVWDVETGKLLNTISIEASSGWPLAFSPDGKLLAYGRYDGLVHIWEIAAEHLLRILTGHTNSICSVAFSPDGTLLAGSGGSGIRVWEVHTGQCLKTLQEHRNEVQSVTFTPDGKQLISGGMDQTVRVWDVLSGDHLRTIQGYEQPVRSVKYGPDGTVIASGGDNRVIRLWDVQSGTCLRTLQGHSHWIQCVAFSPDGTLLASCGDDQTVRVWKVHTGRCLKILRGHEGWIGTVAFNHDGSLLASGGAYRVIRIWETRTGQCIHTLEAYETAAGSVAFSPDGSLLASEGHDHIGSLKLWDPQTGEHLATFGQADYSNIAFSPDGSLLVTSGDNDTALVWDMKTRECLHVLQGHSNRVSSLAFHPNGKLLASGSKDRTIRLWELALENCQHILQGHTFGITSLDFSPDGQTLISGSTDGTIKLWDIARGICIRTLISDRPYERMNVTGVQGLTHAQKATLKTLGAVDDED